MHSMDMYLDYFKSRRFRKTCGNRWSFSRLASALAPRGTDDQNQLTTCIHLDSCKLISLYRCLYSHIAYIFKGKCRNLFNKFLFLPTSSLKQERTARAPFFIIKTRTNARTRNASMKKKFLAVKELCKFVL